MEQHLLLTTRNRFNILHVFSLLQLLPVFFLYLYNGSVDECNLEHNKLIYTCDGHTYENT